MFCEGFGQIVSISGRQSSALIHSRQCGDVFIKPFHFLKGGLRILLGNFPDRFQINAKIMMGKDIPKNGPCGTMKFPDISPAGIPKDF